MYIRRVRESSRASNDLGSERANAAFPRWIQIHGRRRPNSPVEKKVSFSSAVLQREFFNILAEDAESHDSSIESPLSVSSSSESSDTDSSDGKREENEKQISKLRCRRISSYRRQLLSLINSDYSSRSSKKSYFKNLSRLLSKYRKPVKKLSPVTLERISSQLHPRNRKPRHKPNNKRFHHIYEENVKRLICDSMPKHFTMTLNPEVTPRQYLCTLDPVRDTLSSSGAGKSKSWRRDRPNSRGTQESSAKSQSRRSETFRSRSPSLENDGARKRLPIKRSEENAVGDRESVNTRRRRKYRNGSVSLCSKPSTTSRRSTDSGKDQSETSPSLSRRHSWVEVERSLRDDKRTRETGEGEASTAKTGIIKERRRIKKNKIKSASSTHSISCQHNDSDNAEKNSDSCPAIKPKQTTKKMKTKVPDCSLSVILHELMKNNRVRNDSPYTGTKENKEEKTNVLPPRRRTLNTALIKKRYRREMKVANMIATFADTHTKLKSAVNILGISQERPFDNSENFGDSKSYGKDDSSVSETENLESARQIKHRIKSPSESSVGPKVKLRKRYTTRKEVLNSLLPSSYKKKDVTDTIDPLATEDIKRNDDDKVSVSSTNLKDENGKTENSHNRLLRSSAVNAAREKLIRCIRESGAPRKRSKSRNAASKKESRDSIGRRSRHSSRQSKGEEVTVKQIVASCSRSSRQGRRGESTREEKMPKTASGKRPKSQGNKQDKKIPVQRRPRRRPPKGYLTFEQVVGATQSQPAEQLSWEALVNARDENGVSPVGLLRLKRRRRSRRLLTSCNSFQKPYPSVDLMHRKRSAAMAAALELAARRLVVRQRLGIERNVARETSPPSRRKKRNRTRALIPRNTSRGAFRPAFPNYKPILPRARRKW